LSHPYENEPPEAINHEIDSLSRPFLAFLRDKTIPETIKFYKNMNLKKTFLPGLKAFFLIFN
jgi:hypothetical protein